MLFSPPNILTMFRIALIPAIVAAFYIPGDLGHWIALGLFVAAGLSDFLDGYLARSMNLTSRFGKLMDPAGSAAYTAMSGLPGFMVWPAMALELLGGIAIIIGYQTRYVSLALAGFSILTAALFHNNFADQAQMINFLKAT
jgi:phosphatidylglycerophosphate synthase